MSNDTESVEPEVAPEVTPVEEKSEADAAPKEAAQPHPLQDGVEIR